MSNHKIICGKSEIELKQFEDNTFDSCVTDPPYGLEFMGKEWDKFEAGENIAGGTISTEEGSYWKKRPNIPSFYQLNNSDLHAFQQFTYEWATELYRVMKPGAHILVFGGDRTEHRMKCGVEDAGFEIRGTVVYCYGSGFPKSLNISKQLDLMAGVERDVIGIDRQGCSPNYKCTSKDSKNIEIPAPISEEAIQWNGWGTGLKPAVELICMARKPISERNIASNVLKWGVGGLNIGETRIGYLSNRDKESARIGFANIGWKHSGNTKEEMTEKEYDLANQQGRFPANLILECCCEDDELVEGELKASGGTNQAKSTLFGIEHNPFNYADKEGNEKCLIHTNPNCVCRMLDDQSGESKSTDSIRHNNQSDISGKKGIYGKFNNKDTQGFSDNGGASRFFYQAKASQNERWFYCTICKAVFQMAKRDEHIHGAPEKTKYQFLEFHPTQKPENLICYLMRLITPPNGTAIDPFLGSGTAIIAAEREGFNCVGIDSKQEYCEMGYVRGKAELIQQKISGERSTIERIGF